MTLTISEFITARMNDQEWRDPEDCGLPADMIAAIRAIVAEHAPYVGPYDPDPYCRMCVSGDGWPAGGGDEIGVPYPCLTLRLLAAPHASHPDYRQEWAAQ